MTGSVMPVRRDSTLLRSLSLAPGSGIIEDIGALRPFEMPCWAAEHPVIPLPGARGRSRYLLPFHPLDLDEAALHALMGSSWKNGPQKLTSRPRQWS